MESSSRLAFGWVLHQHQPVGNLPWVFQQVYDACYDPLLALFERHPQIRATMHYSGPLIDWLIEKQSQYLDRLAALVDRKQIELISGGYYEPILPILPDYDQQGQIHKLNAFIEQRFGAHPQGMWLAERVWEPQLPSVIARTGLKYTIVDDVHFIMAGIEPDRLYNPYLTDDQGYPLAVFPNPKTMRELIPFRSLAAVEQKFRDLAGQLGERQHIVVMADDGEKFGSWPGTYDRLWRKGGMDRFMELLEASSSWLETVTLSEYLQQRTIEGRVYLPTASYSEMMEWALPANRSAELEETRKQLERTGNTSAISFLRGGSWRNFAAKYAESNTFQKKLLRVHHKIHAAAEKMDPAATMAAFDQLWQGECNCGYWHGAFGGIYISDIRSAIFQHLIHAEAIVDAALHKMDPEIDLVDFDLDGSKELLVEGSTMNLYCSPHDGGTIFEWDWKVVPFNVADTMARRPEAYHRKLLHSNISIIPQVSPLEEQHIDLGPVDAWGVPLQERAASIHDIVQAKEAGLDTLLTYDRYRKAVLRLHLLDASTTIDQFIANQQTEFGDFDGGAYTQSVHSDEASTISIEFQRTASVVLPQGETTATVTKHLQVSWQESSVSILITVKNTGTLPFGALLAVESNWGIVGGNNVKAWYLIDGGQPAEGLRLDQRGTEYAVHSLAMVNTAADISIRQESTDGVNIWRYPVETVNNSEAGFERSYQCTATVLHWPVYIEPGSQVMRAMKISIARP